MSKKRIRKLESARIHRARELADIDTTNPDVTPPHDSVPADENELLHNNTYSRLPRFYVDRVVVCRDCATEEVWPAERQKWWYEVAKGDINTTAVYCSACRQAKRERRSEARRVHLEGLQRKAEERKKR